MTLRALVACLLLLPLCGCAAMLPRDGQVQGMYSRQHNLLTGQDDRETTGVAVSLRWDFRPRRRPSDD